MEQDDAPQAPAQARRARQHPDNIWFSLDKMEVLSDPPTEAGELTAKGKHKVEFKGLDNAKFYRFKICTINENFRVESEWSTPAQPSANKEKALYKQEKRLGGGQDHEDSPQKGQGQDNRRRRSWRRRPPTAGADRTTSTE